VRNDAGRVVALPDYTGEFYITVLERLHRLLEPRTYLEIGTSNGESLRIASCDTLAIDPAFNIDGTVIGSKPRCMLFQMPSDRFSDCTTRSKSSALRPTSHSLMACT
jgi:hypothetical protein